MRAATPPEPRRPHHKRRSAGTDTTRRPTEPVGGPDVLSNVRSERVRAVAALGRRSVRVREGLFLAEGPQAVREAVRCRPDAVREIYTDAAGRERCEEILADAAAAGIPVRDTTAQVLAAMCVAGGGALERAYVNNGGDIALHLAPGRQSAAVAALSVFLTEVLRDEAIGTDARLAAG